MKKYNFSIVISFNTYYNTAYKVCTQRTRVGFMQTCPAGATGGLQQYKGFYTFIYIYKEDLYYDQKVCNGIGCRNHQ